MRVVAVTVRCLRKVDGSSAGPSRSRRRAARAARLSAAAVRANRAPTEPRGGGIARLECGTTALGGAVLELELDG